LKVVILAGGFGTRISEESHLKPKPMIEIGERPILWHIMKIYSSYGFNDFIICLGYKAYIIKEYFADYYLHTSDVTFDLSCNSMTVHNNNSEPWKVTLVDTGLETMTGGRIRRIQPYIGSETFLLTYGDGVSDVNLSELVRFHQSHEKTMTVTAIRLDQRFGILAVDESNKINAFREKSKDDCDTINGGFMVCNPEIFHYLKGDDTILEKEPIESLVRDGQLMAYKHDGFWQCMDTQRDKQRLENVWATGSAPWKIW